MIDLTDVYSGQHVLVTGAGGFIGSHLVEALVRLGARVRAFVRYNGRQDWGYLNALPTELLNRVNVMSGDITDPFTVREAVRGCHTVFHLAALIGIPYSYTAPQHYVSVNVQGSLNVLEACRQFPIHRLVQTSTSEVYGSAQYTPMDEAHPLQAQSPYAATKIAADQLAQSYVCSFDLPVSIIRPFNAYGPRQSLRAVIPTIVAQAIMQPAIQLGSLHPQRDFTYVADTVEGFLRVAASPYTVGQVTHIGSGQAISIGELAGSINRLVAEITGQPEKPLITDDDRQRPEASEVRCLLASYERARQWLDWQPTVELESGLRRVIEDWRHHYQINSQKTASYII